MIQLSFIGKQKVMHFPKTARRVLQKKGGDLMATAPELRTLNPEPNVTRCRPA